MRRLLEQRRRPLAKLGTRRHHFHRRHRLSSFERGNATVRRTHLSSTLAAAAAAIATRAFSSPTAYQVVVGGGMGDGRRRLGGGQPPNRLQKKARQPDCEARLTAARFAGRIRPSPSIFTIDIGVSARCRRGQRVFAASPRRSLCALRCAQCLPPPGGSWRSAVTVQGGWGDRPLTYVAVASFPSAGGIFSRCRQRRRRHSSSSSSASVSLPIVIVVVAVAARR